MQLIGMLDSPFVRRVAVSMRLMGVPFEHRSVSVFRHFDTFHAINPLVKAPTMICDDGTVLMESTLLLEEAEAQADPSRSLMPKVAPERQKALRIVGLALIAAEKSVQIEYEKKRPENIRYQPWLERIEAQMHAGFDALEDYAQHASPWLLGEKLTQADVTTAIAWRFAQLVTPTHAPAGNWPHLAALCAKAEALPEFLAFPPE